MKEENGWVGGENETARWKLQGLSYLNYFCYILLITQTNPSTMWGKLHKGVNTRGRDHWGLSLRLPTAMEVEDEARKQEENTGRPASKTSENGTVGTEIFTLLPL